MAVAPSRRVELDVLRGVAVAGMILVVSPGDWAMTYAPFRHAEWDGWTLADLVFPAFLFCVGISLGLSFPRPWQARRDRPLFWRRLLRRVALLIVIGLLLESTFNLCIAAFGGAIGKPGIENLRIPGILQRIALCYLLAALVVVGTSRRDAAARIAIRPYAIGLTIALLLVGYWALLTYVPVPGHGVGRLDPAGNLAAYVDRLIFTPAHLWPLGWATWDGPVVYDPEGLLSTLSAATDTLFGVLAGWAWRHHPERAGIVIGCVGIAILVTGLLLDPLVAINKRIWTSSFALLGSGFAGALLAALILTQRGRAMALFTPFAILGANAILAFVASTLLGRVYDMPIVPAGELMVAPRAWLNGAMRTAVGDPYLASTLCAALFVVVVTAALWPLHRRKLHVRL